MCGGPPELYDVEYDPQADVPGVWKKRCAVGLRMLGSAAVEGLKSHAETLEREGSGRLCKLCGLSAATLFLGVSQGQKYGELLRVMGT